MGFLEFDDKRVRRDPMCTILTLDHSCGSMQFENMLTSSLLMEPINVLGDDGPQEAIGFPTSQNAMSVIRIRGGHGWVRLTFLPPVFFAGLLRAHEGIVEDGRIFRPNTTGRSEIRYATFRTNAGARECDCIFRGGNPLR